MMATTATAIPAAAPAGNEGFETTEMAVEVGFADDDDAEGVAAPLVDVVSLGEVIGTTWASAFIEAGSAWETEKLLRS